MSDQNVPNEPIPLPITPEIDLHAFRPSEVSSLLREYIRECREKNILLIRIVHGKGTGTLREGVHRLLDKMKDEVLSYTLGNETTGGWGATVATLKGLGSDND